MGKNNPINTARREWVLGRRKQFGLFLRRIRLNSEMSMREVGEELKINHTTVGDIECGKCAISDDLMMRIAAFTGMNVHILSAYCGQLSMEMFQYVTGDPEIVLLILREMKKDLVAGREVSEPIWDTGKKENWEGDTLENEIREYFVLDYYSGNANWKPKDKESINGEAEFVQYIEKAPADLDTIIETGKL